MRKEPNSAVTGKIAKVAMARKLEHEFVGTMIVCQFWNGVTRIGSMSGGFAGSKNLPFREPGRREILA